MRLKLLLNPAAGRGRARGMAESAVSRLKDRGAVVDLAISRDQEHLSELSREASRGDWDRIVSCGGDGTLHWVLRGLDRTRVTLAVLGMGSGDDFARVIGMPRVLDEACAAILDGPVREVDVATANGIPFLGVAGLGFDSEVARYANDHVRWLRGPAVYPYAILRVLGKFRPHRVRIAIDGEWRDEQVMFIAVGNTHRYGGGIAIVPTARPDDGLLDVCIVERCSRWQLLRTLPRAYGGGHVRSPYVRIERGRRIAIEADADLEVFADGEPLTRAPVSLAIAPQRVRVVTGPGAMVGTASA